MAIHQFFFWVFKTASSIHVRFPSSFFNMHFICVQVVSAYNSTDMATAWKNSRFILLELLDFNMVFNLLIAVHA